MAHAGEREEIRARLHTSPDSSKPAMTSRSVELPVVLVVAFTEPIVDPSVYVNAVATNQCRSILQTGTSLQDNFSQIFVNIHNRKNM